MTYKKLKLMCTKRNLYLLVDVVIITQCVELLYIERRYSACGDYNSMCVRRFIEKLVMQLVEILTLCAVQKSTRNNLYYLK